MESMNWLKQECGCGELTKDELKELINTTCRVKDFIKNDKACAMLHRLASRSQELVDGDQTNVIKYLEILKECERRDLEKVMELIGEGLPENNGDDRRGVLKQFFIEYSARLSEEELYNTLLNKFTQAYKELK